MFPTWPGCAIWHENSELTETHFYLSNRFEFFRVCWIGINLLNKYIFIKIWIFSMHNWRCPSFRHCPRLGTRPVALSNDTKISMLLKLAIGPKMSDSDTYALYVLQMLYTSFAYMYALMFYIYNALHMFCICSNVLHMLHTCFAYVLCIHMLDVCWHML